MKNSAQTCSIENIKTSQILQVSEVEYAVHTELHEDVTVNNTEWIWAWSCRGSVVDSEMDSDVTHPHYQTANCSILFLLIYPYILRVRHPLSLQDYIQMQFWFEHLFAILVWVFHIVQYETRLHIV